MICEACNVHQAIGVAALPFAPVSCAFCVVCLITENYPLGHLIANTACIGGLAEAHDAWQGMVEKSCQYQGVTLGDFETRVAQLNKELEELF